MMHVCDNFAVVLNHATHARINVIYFLFTFMHDMIQCLLFIFSGRLCFPSLFIQETEAEAYIVNEKELKELYLMHLILLFHCLVISILKQELPKLFHLPFRPFHLHPIQLFHCFVFILLRVHTVLTHSISTLFGLPLSALRFILLKHGFGFGAFSNPHTITQSRSRISVSIGSRLDGPDFNAFFFYFSKNLKD